MNASSLSCTVLVAWSTFLYGQEPNPEVASTLQRIQANGGTFEREVVSVSFGFVKSYTGEEIVKLVPLYPHLRSLDLFGTAVTDHGLRDVHKLTELTTLDVRETRITDDAFAHIGRLRRLRTLYVSDTAVTGARLDELKQLNELTHLSLSRTELSREGVQLLKLLPQLERLSLSQTSIDNAGVAELAPLVHLDELSLGGTKIEGAGGFTAAWAAAHPMLNDLDLGSTRVDDRCIAGVASLPKLQSLAIAGTRITPAGLSKFAQLRRGIDIADKRFWMVASRGQLTPDVHEELSKTFEEITIQVIEDEP